MHVYDAFVSYSSQDKAFVEPAVEMMAVGRRPRIFWDVQVEPGDRWMTTIAGALANSAALIVIWCCHSAESPYVAAEIEHALAQDKPVVPIWICPYPPREPLDEFQGIDFRRQAQHTCVARHLTESNDLPLQPASLGHPKTALRLGNVGWLLACLLMIVVVAPRISKTADVWKPGGVFGCSAFLIVFMALAAVSIAFVAWRRRGAKARTLMLVEAIEKIVRETAGVTRDQRRVPAVPSRSSTRPSAGSRRRD